MTQTTCAGAWLGGVPAADGTHMTSLPIPVSVFSVCEMSLIPTSDNPCEMCKLSSQQFMNEWWPFPPFVLLTVASVWVILP